MQDVFNKYVNYLEVERNASRYTVRNYTHDLLDFFTFLKNKDIKSLNEVDRLMVREYLAHLVQSGFVKSSIARRLSAIRSLYRYLLREQIVSSSPVATTTSPKLDKRLPDFLTPNETGRS
jgi:integrase/recombinase XerC